MSDAVDERELNKKQNNVTIRRDTEQHKEGRREADRDRNEKVTETAEAEGRKTGKEVRGVLCNQKSEERGANVGIGRS